MSTQGHQLALFQGLGAALQAQDLLNEEEWEMLKGNSDQCTGQQVDLGQLKELGFQVMQLYAAPL